MWEIDQKRQKGSDKLGKCLKFFKLKSVNFSKRLEIIHTSVKPVEHVPMTVVHNICKQLY